MSSEIVDNKQMVRDGIGQLSVLVDNIWHQQRHKAEKQALTALENLTEPQKRDKCVFMYDKMHSTCDVSTKYTRCIEITKSKHLKEPAGINVIEGQCDIWLGEGEYIIGQSAHLTDTAALIEKLEGMKKHETALTPLNNPKVIHNAAIDAIIYLLKE